MVKNFAAVAASDAVCRGFFFLFNIIVARTIEPAEFGIYGLAISLGVWLWAVADAGLTAHATSLLAQGVDRSKTVSSVLVARLPVLAVLIVMLTASLYVLPLPFHEKLIYYSIIAYVLGMSLFPAWIARAYHANREYLLSYGAILVSGLIFLAAYLSGAFEKDGLTACLARNLSWLTGSLMGLCLVAKRMGVRFHWMLQIKLLMKTMPLGIAAIVYRFIPLAPFLMIRIMGKPEELSSYSALMQVQAILLASGGLFSSVFLPTVSQLISCGDRILTQAINTHFKMLLPYLLLMFALYSIFGKWAVENIYGIVYGTSPFAPMLLGGGFLFASLRLSIDSILITKGFYMKMAINGMLSLSLLIISLLVVRSSVSFSASYALGELVLLSLNTRLAREIINRKTYEKEGA